MTNKVSVAMCTYNGEKYLDEQLDSILNQTQGVNEIVACDDGSSDNTIAILKKYSAKHPGLFKIHQNEINLRSVKNFEKAIGLCTGDFIFLSDQDDKWVLDKVENYTKFFRDNPKIQVLASNGYCINEKSEIEEKYAVWDVPKFLRDENIAIDYYKIITNIANLATGASMAIRREIVSEVLPFPAIKDFHHDEWIALLAARKNAFELLDGKYFYYRTHQHQQVGGVFFKKSSMLKKKFIELFDIDNFNYPFSVLKKRLKVFSRAYKKNSLLSTQQTHRKYFVENTETNKKYYNLIWKEMRRRFAVKSLVLWLTDKMVNKRQLKKK